MKIRRGNIFDSAKPYLVNPVNTVGVMGKGLAAQFKRKYPNEMFTFYRVACDDGTLRTGAPLVWNNPRDDQKNVILFPTKQHWKDPSEIYYVTHGLQYYLDEFGDCDAAFPLLGAGYGNLNPNMVLDTMKDYLRDTECEIWIN